MELKLLTAIFCALFSWQVLADEVTSSNSTNYNVKDVLETLEHALAYHDEIPTLDKSKIIGRDQRSALEDLDDDLSDLIELFESEVLIDQQIQYQKLEQRIAEEKVTRQKYRKEVVLAVSDERSLASKLLPGETLKSMVAVSKADYQTLIDATDKNIKAYKKEQESTLSAIRSEFLAMQIDLTTDQIDVLMTSVIGDEILTMTVTFNALKDVVLKLEQLSDQSGEDLVYAKKYFGMVVVLYRLMDKIQVEFIRNVENNFLPRLEELEDEGKAAIAESKKLISDKVRVETLKNNIESNKETLDVISIYREVLEDQLDKVKKANELNHKEMAVADNTYRTVSLSSAVVGLITESANNFSRLMSLQIPDVREFQNTEIRETFKILSGRINHKVK